MTLTVRARALTGLLLAILVLWTGMDRAGLTLIAIVNTLTNDVDNRIIFLVASLIPLGVAVWSWLLARSALREAPEPGPDHTLAQTAWVLGLVAIVVSALATIATMLVSIPGPPFTFHFAG